MSEREGPMTEDRRQAHGEPMPPDGHRPELHTGTEGPVDAEDVALASGRDPTPENLRLAQRELDEEGKAAAEKLVE